MSVKSACIHVHHMCAVPLGVREIIISPGPGVTDVCEPPHRYWELNLDPLSEPQVLLTAGLYFQLFKLQLGADAPPDPGVRKRRGPKL